jgi:enterobacterial common antigen flippase
MSNSYSQILKSSSIVGGARAANLLVGLIRTKLVAVLLGPSGVGLIGLYTATLELVETVSGLGIRSSGVRQVAEAHGTGDPIRVGQTVLALRRLCWLTGLLGTILTAALAWPLSIWTFGNPERAWAIAVLGLTLLLSALSGGQMTLIQGMRRIGDLARLQVLSAVGGTVVSVLLYAWIGERGIVPALILSAVVNLGFSWWLAGRITVPMATLSGRETVQAAKGFVTLGLAFMWSALLLALVALATRTLIVRGYGIEANGVYQAAWAISGVFAGFILQAMGADFYPRLTAVAHDNTQVNRLVNEQTEIGILLALPGLLATLVFSPWIIRVLYSVKFTEAAELLPYFVIGIFGRVVSWPLGFIQLAKGAGKWFASTETAFAALQMLLVVIGLRLLGLKGVAVAFALLYFCYTLGVLWVASRLSGFTWSTPAVRLLAISGLLMLGTFALSQGASPIVSAVVGSVVSAASSVYCLRQVCARLGSAHRVSQGVRRLPLIGRILAA